MEVSGSPAVSEAAEGDIDRSLLRRRELATPQLPVVSAVALGGAIGASARYGISLLLPAAPTAFPISTLLINAVGCVVIGIFMALVAEGWSPHRLVRPFCCTGVLGGFTTFSTFTVDIQRLLDAGQLLTGLAYLSMTLLTALAGVWAAAAATRWAVRRRR